MFVEVEIDFDRYLHEKFEIMHGSSVHSRLPGILDKAIILVFSPLVPDSAIGDLITQQPSIHIGTVPSGCRYNCSCNLH